MHIGVTSHLVAQVRLARVIPTMHVYLCVASWLFSPRLSRPLLRPTVLLPALPDVYLRVQREVQVQPPVRLPLGTVVTSDYETPSHISEQFESILLTILPRISILLL